MTQPSPQPLVTTIRSKREMLDRLIAVDKWPHLLNYLYPDLLEAAGKRLSSRGVVMHIVFQITDLKDQFRPEILVPLYGKVPQFVDAMVADDAVAAEAKAWFQNLYEQFAAQREAAAV